MKNFILIFTFFAIGVFGQNNHLILTQDSDSTSIKYVREMCRFFNVSEIQNIKAEFVFRFWNTSNVLEIKDKIIKLFDYNKKKYKDRNTHMYKKCPKCKQKIRLPLKKGKHTVKCPNCGNRFDVACHKDEKIKVEIIK
jgi:predicted RNA-binding Zn-ribbon protein involved in translation (DUF1610 family)